MAEAAAQFTVNTVETTPYDDQKPGTSGLRKKVKVFEQPNYLQNFIHAILETQKLQGATLTLGGDGRYFSDVAIQSIIKQCAGFGVSKLIIGQKGLFATPAVSATIRKLKANGGIILTASHNPGGPNEDFGVKYNIATGGPAPSDATTAMFEYSKSMTSYVTSTVPDIDINTLATHKFGNFTVEVIDSTDIYTNLLKTIFDFPKISQFLKTKNFPILVSGLHGVGGPYAHRIIVKELGLPESYLDQCNPLPDFGGGHPDPNLTYAKKLVDLCYAADGPQLGAAFDGDADRNMILGKQFFVNPSDSLAVISANAQECIPYFSTGLKGVARSMPTSAAVDQVAKKLGVQMHETPTGWKFFGNLLANGLCSICGEESFGTSSDHISEKDGPWALLCWLSILACKNENSEQLVTVENVVREFWETYGRNYYTRYDYEGVSKEGALQMMDHLRGFFGNDEILKPLNIVKADEFAYKDPTDGSEAKNQGIRFFFEDGSRVIYRLSGTGSAGATIRMYIDKYDSVNLDTEPKEILASLVKVGSCDLAQIEKFTGRTAPTVIT